MGHFNKAEVVPKRKLWEFRVSWQVTWMLPKLIPSFLQVTPDMIIPMGTQIRARHFVPGQVRFLCFLCLISCGINQWTACWCMRRLQGQRDTRSNETVGLRVLRIVFFLSCETVLSYRILWISGGRATHGNSLAHRTLGATGQRQVTVMLALCGRMLTNVICIGPRQNI